ncbi:hypothetical protein [Algicella marina]|uniref:SGNH/GDSL hydrolase family protein n=1 Tax=Algicella marina TaxID=2683284 RepID=A0A6P1T647_9RHOB|nr:hypothetical protein [Algicella marina]QHQ37160.1 hypothetical protein GO499_19215 [Algicella marina]
MRYLIGLCVLLGVLVTVNAISVFVFEPIDTNTEIGRSISSRMDRLGMENDVVFFGDSRSHQGLDPRVIRREYQDLTGESMMSLNLARPGQQVPVSYYALENYMARADVAPKHIVVNFSHHIMYGREWFQAYYLHGFRPTAAQAVDAERSGLVSLPGAVEWYLRTRLPAWHGKKTFHNNLIPALTEGDGGLVAALDNQRKLEATLYDPEIRGFYPRGLAYIAADERNVTVPYEPARDDAVLLSYVPRMARLAADHGAELVIFEFPWPEIYRDSAVDKYSRDRLTTVLKTVLADEENVRFISYDPFMPPENFADPLHLNSRGAEALSRLMAGWLARPEGR